MSVVTSAQTLTVMHTFENTDGANPQAELIQDKSGNLYSTTEYGGPNEVGNVFKIDTRGNYSVLYNFTDTPDGARPIAPLVIDASGNLYGTTYSGGKNCNIQFTCGTVFKLDPVGNETQLHIFAGNPDGSNPWAGLVADGQGNYYGTTVYGGVNGVSGVVFEIDSSGNESVIHSFTGGTDGLVPYAPLAFDSSGNLWGTTAAGGGSHNCQSGCGTIYKLTHTASGWRETVIHAFSGTDGAVPYARLTLDKTTGNFYGTTTIGGNQQNCLYLGQPAGCGTVFEISRAGKEKVIYNFSGKGDGSEPYANVVFDANGNLYGTTVWGGNFTCNAYTGCGAVFRLSANGKEKVLHSFSGGTDGSYPDGALLVNSTGTSIYGTAPTGGDDTCQT